MLLEVNKILKTFNGKKILNNISFKVYKSDRVGIVGSNGAGKSTLLKIISDEIDTDSGYVNIKSSYKVLPQKFEFDNNTTVYNYIKNNINYGNTGEIISKFNFKDKQNQKIAKLSGGEKTRLVISVLIENNPDILILDEPTNHLDIETVNWLVNYLDKYKGVIIIVSHDRYVLNKLANRIIELKDGEIKEYNGNYDLYLSEKNNEERRKNYEYEKYVSEKKRLIKAASEKERRSATMRKTPKRMGNSEARLHKMGNQKSKSKLDKAVKAIEARIEKLDVKERPKKESSINVKFAENTNKTGKVLIRGENIKKQYNKILFEDAEFTVFKGKRIALVGKNGSGKSTLLKVIINGVDYSGKISISPAAKIGFISQELEVLDTDKTILDEIKCLDTDEVISRNFLGAMLFKEKDIYKKTSSLSMGEKVRLAFCKLILSNCNLLILDEPTNFLDSISREKIENALETFTGTLLFVSHDRYFIEKIADEIWEIENKKINVYNGDYKYYLNKKNEKEKNFKLNGKEEKIKLQMKLAEIVYKLEFCSEKEKDILNQEYMEIVKKLKSL